MSYATKGNLSRQLFAMYISFVLTPGPILKGPAISKVKGTLN